MSRSPEVEFCICAFRVDIALYSVYANVGWGTEDDITGVMSWPFWYETDIEMYYTIIL